MNERPKYIAFFLGDIDDYGIVLLGLFIVTMVVPEHPIALISIATYSVLYLLRYRRKSNISQWDKFKLAFTFLVLIGNLEFFLLNQLSTGLLFILYLIWICTYYYDRILLRVTAKLTWLVTGMLMLVCWFVVVYAQLKSYNHAQEQDRAEALARDTEKLQKIAEQEAANALEALDRVKALEIELKNCQKSK